MCVVVVLRNRVRADDNIYIEFRLDKIAEFVDMRAWRISHHHARCKMNNFGTIFLHFFNAILNVTAWASSTGGISDEFDFLALVYAEGSFSLL